MSIGGLRHVLFAVALWCAASAEAPAEKRIALVIGNSGYQHAVPLANPANDAAAIAKLLKDIGFDAVELRRDVLAIELRRAIRDFALRASDADLALVYYAGHGFEMNGTNYFVPTDARLERDRDIEDETVPLDRFLGAVEPARRLRLVILDACRDNPLVKKMRRAFGTRAIGQGLAKIDVTSTDTLIAFAAKAGSVATDGEGPNSPFTAALLKHLPTPGLDVRILFGRVRDDVFISTGRKQEPFVYGSLGGSDITLVPAPALPPAAPAGDPHDDYQLAERVGTVEAWDLFLARHGTGFYANLAREQRAKLQQTGRRPDAEAARSRQEEERSFRARKAEADTIKQREEEARRAQAAEAERQRLEREKAEREKTQREELARAEREKAQREELARAQREKAQREEAARAEEQRRLAREQAEREKGNAQLAMLPPAPQAPASRARPQLLRGDLILAIKRQLRRVGCFPGKIDESWGDPAITRSLAQFARYARFSGPTNEPNHDLLDALSGSRPDVCPLECGRREVARNGRCVANICPPGHAVGGDGACIPVAPGASRR